MSNVYNVGQLRRRTRRICLKRVAHRFNEIQIHRFNEIQIVQREGCFSSPSPHPLLSVFMVKPPLSHGR